MFKNGPKVQGCTFHRVAQGFRETRSGSLMAYRTQGSQSRYKIYQASSSGIDCNLARSSRSIQLYLADGTLDKRTFA